MGELRLESMSYSQLTEDTIVKCWYVTFGTGDGKPLILKGKRYRGLDFPLSRGILRL